MKKHKNEIDILVLMGKRLRELRDKAGLTQAQVGQIMGLKMGTISGHESGRTDINFLTLLKYAAIYKINFTDMLSFISAETDLVMSLAPQNPFYKNKSNLHKYIEYIEYALQQSGKRESQLIEQNLKISIGVTALINEIKNLSSGKYK